MDAADAGAVHRSVAKHFDEKVEERAEKHQHLRGRNNVTCCRSPTRGHVTKLMKEVLQHKRHLEFQRRRRRRPESPELNPKISTAEPEEHRERRHAPTPESTSSTSMCLKSGSEWALSWSQPTTQIIRKEESLSRRREGTSSTSIITERPLSVQKTQINTCRQSEIIPQSEESSFQSERIVQKKTQRDASSQTGPGSVTVKESEVQRLAQYLQEALWREEEVKRKMDALQSIASGLLNSSNTIWTARCNEDLLRNKINALEAQLQLYLQKFPKHGMKKLVLQMEKQKMVYEEKALTAVQKATQEKTAALTEAGALQGALQTARAEALRWQGLYEELMQSSLQLKESQDVSREEVQQLHSQLELSRVREAELRELVESVQRENQDLWNNTSLLEKEGADLREELQSLRDSSTGSWGIMAEETPENGVHHGTPTDPGVPEELRRTLDRLRLKEMECAELQTELEAVEQECQWNQVRLSQCREELRSSSSSKETQEKKLFGSWRPWCSLLLLGVLGVVGLAMWWPWHQVQDLYSDLETRVENYLVEMASPRNSGCFKPV